MTTIMISRKTFKTRQLSLRNYLIIECSWIEFYEADTSESFVGVYEFFEGNYFLIFFSV